ncbi:iron-sulfur cluster assembly accessory protein [Ancylostoma caninum]|uniref:Iron-sulfur cluster assembly accessory protein n=1 Tax=Ancylostoma caninum TaxID=29170 RepID=A0A368FTA1_ANCCA|nr:iron-sulfur cluster assembly accessory protein [Ancylostoma caninum]
MLRSSRTATHLVPIFSRSFCIPSSAVRTLTTEDIKVTDRAHQRLKKILAEGERLRVEVDGGGCSGFEYKIKLDTKLQKDDRLWKGDNVELHSSVNNICSYYLQLSLGYLRGATIDYVEDLMKASFRVVNNPVAEKGCSCGSSFALKMD